MTLSEIKLTNSLSGKKEIFKSQEVGKVSLYGCGPTVYGLTHVGNARAFLTQDLVCRVLRRAGYSVTLARNYTDIDDKIIARAEAEHQDAQSVAGKYADAFDLDMQSLRILEPQIKPRATETIPEIIAMIQMLVDKGFAYVIETSFGRDLYFDVQKFSKYGKLSGRNLKDSESGYRIEADDKKRHHADFAVWKASKTGEPSWPSPWGPGRPGWHIECSAMIKKFLGKTIDIHMGGIDLLFPHHENEIAQSEACHDASLAHYWLHNGLLELGAIKMSKSIGNLVSTRDFLDDYGTDTFRLLMLGHHYRSPLDFSPDTVAQAENLWMRVLKAFLVRDTISGEALVAGAALPPEFRDLNARMEQALFDDFNAAKALGFLWAALRAAYRENSTELKALWQKIFLGFQDIFELQVDNAGDSLREAEKRQAKRWNLNETERKWIEDKITERHQLRQKKDFAAADALRNDIESKGFLIMDGPAGTDWRKKDANEV